LGIGLFIAAEIISWYMGKTEAINPAGKGSAFNFSLPLNN
jgi:signal transduction histidine kinase